MKYEAVIGLEVHVTTGNQVQNVYQSWNRVWKTSKLPYQSGSFGTPWITTRDEFGGHPKVD